MEDKKELTLYDLEKQLIEELDGLKEELKADNNANDTVTEIIDGIIPVYTYDSLTVAGSVLWIATEKAEGGETPLEQINANIYTHLSEKAHEWAENNDVEL